jgi:peroxiredoxin
MRSLFILLAGALCLAAADVPRRAPGFALPDINMKVHDLYDYRGKPLILEFMNTKCPHCAAFAEVLQRVQQQYGDRVGILVVANPPDNFDTVKQFADGHQATYPILFDMGQAAFSYLLQQRFDLPQVFLIDAAGMIQQHYEYGPMTRNIFEGDGLPAEVGRMLAPAAATKGPSTTKKK